MVLELQSAIACAMRRDPKLTREQAEMAAILFAARVVGQDDVGRESLSDCLVRMDGNQKCLIGRIDELCGRIQKLESIIESLDRRKQRLKLLRR